MRVVSGAEKKSFDRGGPVWPPRSNVTNDRFGGGEGSGGALPPQPKTGGSGGQRPPAKTEKYLKKITVSVLDVFSNQPLHMSEVVLAVQLHPNAQSVDFALELQFLTNEQT